MHRADITQVGTRFEIIKGSRALGARGTVIQGLHFDEAGAFGISVEVEGFPLPAIRPKSRHPGWMVVARKLSYLRPLNDEEPEARFTTEETSAPSS